MNILQEPRSAVASLGRPIYLDHHATTPVDSRVADVMLRVMTDSFGNPNDRGHRFGDEAFRVLERARETTASVFNADAEDVSFGPSATSSIDRLLRHLVPSSGRPMRVAATTVEHGGILDCLAGMEQRGYCEVGWLDVDSKARLNPGQIETTIAQGCDLLIVMAANNEVGTINPIGDIAALARKNDVPIVVDASQYATHLPIDVLDLQIDYLLVSGHKMYGPKGVSAVISGTGRGDFLRQLEKQAGTPDVASIAGLAAACEICSDERHPASVRIADLRDRLEAILRHGIRDLVVNGDTNYRLPHNLHVSVPNIQNEAIVARLANSVALSTGSSCRSGTDTPSHVLRAMRLPRHLIDGALRIGLGSGTTSEDIETAGRMICTAVNDLRRSDSGV